MCYNWARVPKGLILTEFLGQIALGMYCRQIVGDLLLLLVVDCWDLSPGLIHQMGTMAPVKLLVDLPLDPTWRLLVVDV